jgi:hypothetical protein
VWTAQGRGGVRERKKIGMQHLGGGSVMLGQTIRSQSKWEFPYIWGREVMFLKACPSSVKKMGQVFTIEPRTSWKLGNTTHVAPISSEKCSFRTTDSKVITSQELLRNFLKPLLSPWKAVTLQ